MVYINILVLIILLYILGTQLSYISLNLEDQLISYSKLIAIFKASWLLFLAGKLGNFKYDLKSHLGQCNNLHSKLLY